MSPSGAAPSAVDLEPEVERLALRRGAGGRGEDGGGRPHPRPRSGRAGGPGGQRRPRLACPRGRDRDRRRRGDPGRPEGRPAMTRPATRSRRDRLAQIACLLEVTARKPGNVHRFRDFDDVSYLDFVAERLGDRRSARSRPGPRRRRGRAPGGRGDPAAGRVEHEPRHDPPARPPGRRRRRRAAGDRRPPRPPARPRRTTPVGSTGRSGWPGRGAWAWWTRRTWPESRP